MKKNRNKIITSDALVYLNKCKPELFDLIITSPPYDNLRNYKGYNFPFEEIAKGCFKVLKQGGVIVWVVNDATVKGSETLTSFKQAIYFHELGLNLHDTMIFKKEISKKNISIDLSKFKTDEIIIELKFFNPLSLYDLKKGIDQKKRSVVLSSYKIINN